MYSCINCRGEVVSADGWITFVSCCSSSQEIHLASWDSQSSQVCLFSLTTPPIPGERARRKCKEQYARVVQLWDYLRESASKWQSTIHNCFVLADWHRTATAGARIGPCTRELPIEIWGKTQVIARRPQLGNIGKRGNKVYKNKVLLLGLFMSW